MLSPKLMHFIPQQTLMDSIQELVVPFVDQTTRLRLSLILSFLSLLFAYAVSYLVDWRHECGKARLKAKTPTFPDGPRSLPFFGNILSFFNLQRRPDQTLVSLARKYGGMCMLWFGSNPVVIVSSPRVAKDLMDKVSLHWFGFVR